MKKIVQVLLICLIIAGIIVISTAGFNVGLKYSEHDEISINVGSKFNVADIKAIAKEVFGNSNVLVQQVELYKDMVQITVKEATEEQITTLNDKINEKYEIIYVCDLALSKTILDYLNKHPEITNKIKHFDHHEIIENSPYFVNSIIYLNGKPTCGTQLFYNYLLTLDTRFNNKFYKTFVEAIREQDNFDFGDQKYNAKLLAFTHALIGPEEYINLICNLNDNDDFKLPKIYEDLYKSDLKKQSERK